MKKINFQVFPKLRLFFRRSKQLDYRTLSANLLMFSFILFTSVGAAMLLPAAGFITAGVCCGIFGYLLGSD